MAEDRDAALHVRGSRSASAGSSRSTTCRSTVAPGEVVGVIGPNGAGKTTLFNVICGFVAPDAGERALARRLARGVRPHQLAGLGIARTLQGVGLFAGLTAVENVMVGAERHARAGLGSGAARAARAGPATSARLRERALARARRARRRRTSPAALPASLPYGDPEARGAGARAGRRAASCCCSTSRPAGSASDDMAELGRADARAAGRRSSVLLVEHHMDLVMSVCDRVVVLDFGRRDRRRRAGRGPGATRACSTPTSGSRLDAAR